MNNDQNSSEDPLKWVDQYGDYLYNYAFFRLRNKAISEDLVQETFLSALKNIKSFSHKSSIKTWLTAILKNKLVDHFRKSAKDIPLENEDTLFCETEEVFYQKGKWKDYWDITRDPIRWDDTPISNLEKKEFWDTLFKCLDELPERFRAVFTLREMEEMSTENICKELGITSSNIWVMLHRSRKQLRRCLEINWYGGKLFPRK